MSDRREVTASAPGKLMLFGEHAVVYGYPCIVTAVDQRIRVTVRKNGKDAFHLDAPDLGLKAYSKTMQDLGGEGLPKGVRFIETFYKNFLTRYPQREGIDVMTKSDFSESFGFGSSSAVTVAFAKALTELYEIKLTKKQLFEMCYKAVLDVQGVGSGFDVAAAVYGGTLYYVTPGKVIKNLKDDKLSLVVGYTGVKADTPTLVRQVAELRRKEKVLVEAVFKGISVLVEKATDYFEKNNGKEIGSLMDKNQELLESLRVGSVELDNLIGAARDGGALGAKLSGAGGGDCMIAYVTKEKREAVEKKIVENGGEVVKVGIGAEGVRVE